MKVALALMLSVVFFQAAYGADDVTKCMFCKDGTGADSETCTEESLECPNDDDDVCTKVLTKTKDGSSVVKGCGKSTDFNDKKKKCQTAKIGMLDFEQTVCVCKKTDCNSSSALQVSFVAIAAAAIFRYIF